MFSKVKIIIWVFIVIMMTACGSKKYDFEVDAPPKYSSAYLIKSINIINFKSDNSAYKESFIRMIKNGIANEGYIKIVQGGAEATLSGFLNVGKVQGYTTKNSYECKKKVNGKKVKQTCYSFTYKKTHTLKVDYTLTSSQENSVIYGDTLTEEFSDSWYSSKSASDAKSQATSDRDIINKSLQAITKKMVHAISPHKETVSRELQEGDGNENIKLGITYVENGRIEQALSIWDQSIAQSTSPKDKAAAYYNIGVIKESQGAYRDAFDIYSNANALLPKEELYIKAMTRVETLSKKSKRVRKWKKRYQ